MVLRTPRQERRKAVRQYAGGHWSDEASRERIHINLLALYVDIVLRNLIAKNPRVMLSTFDKASKPSISAMQDSANIRIEKIRLGNTLQRIVLDALFSIGIAKVSLATPAEASVGAWNVGVGEAYAQRIDLDDFAFDVHARDFSECAWMAHRYRAPLEVIKESKLYEKSRKDLTASEDYRSNQEGDEKINVLGRGYYGNDEELEDMVDLWEVYLPREKLVVTLSEDCLTGVMAPSHNGEPRALRYQDWIGPERGPYHILGLGTVPGSPMPKAPIMNLVEMQRLVDKIMRKLAWSAENLKEVLVVPKGADGDIERIRDSMHGDILPLDRPKDISMVTMNSPNQLLSQMLIQMKDVFSWLAGNLDIMGGLSPQSKTATQDRMLNENSTRSIADMQDRTTMFASDVISGLIWFDWHHPTKVQESEYSLPGLNDVSITRKLHPWNHPDPTVLRRTAEWDRINCKVDPYSLPASTPQQRANDLIQFVTQLYIPAAQMAQQQGVNLDWNNFLEKLGVYKDMPDLKEILTYQEPLPTPEADAAQSAGQPAPQETAHIRENVATPSRLGNDNMMRAALSGVDPGGAHQNGKLQPQSVKHGNPSFRGQVQSRNRQEHQAWDSRQIRDDGGCVEWTRKMHKAFRQSRQEVGNALRGTGYLRNCG